ERKSRVHRQAARLERDAVGVAKTPCRAFGAAVATGRVAWLLLAYSRAPGVVRRCAYCRAATGNVRRTALFGTAKQAMIPRVQEGTALPRPHGGELLDVVADLAQARAEPVPAHFNSRPWHAHGDRRCDLAGATLQQQGDTRKQQENKKQRHGQYQQQAF